jgi:hypothetical protein
MNMISNNHELTIGELDAVNGGFDMMGGSAMGMISQLMQMVQNQNPVTVTAPQDPLVQVFQQAMNGMQQG